MADMSEPLALPPSRSLPPLERPLGGPVNEERSIGAYLQSVRRLSPEQLAQIGEHQRKTGLRFGEAAVALKMVSEGEVLWALSKQFAYPMADVREPLSAELIVATDPMSAPAETFRDLRSQLVMGVLNPRSPKRALAILGADSGAGCSFMAVNLALSFSQMGARTLLIDANLRRPRLHRLLRVDPDLGLTAVLTGRKGLRPERPLQAFPALHALSAGIVPPNPLELLQSSAMDTVVNEALTHFDFVIIDTPAHELGADARVVAAKAGAALLVGRKQATPMAKLKALTQAIGRDPVAVAGLVMNDA